MLYVVVAGTMVTFLLVAAALRHVSATRVGIVAMLEPVAASARRLPLARRVVRNGAARRRRDRAGGDPARPNSPLDKEVRDIPRTRDGLRPIPSSFSPLMPFSKHIRIGLCGFFAAFAVMPAAEAAALSPNERTLLDAVNDVRAAHDLRPLQVDATLVRAARDYSTTMIRRDIFTHGALGPRLASYGARGPLFGENLAWGTGRKASSPVDRQAAGSRAPVIAPTCCGPAGADRDRLPHRQVPRLRRRDRRHRRLRRLIADARGAVFGDAKRPPLGS